MNVSLGQLNALLQNNVAEVRFIRRRPKPGSTATRRMLCTNSYSLLNSNDGRLTLNYRTPKKSPKYDPAPKNLIVTWDILMQNYRTISVESCDLITVIPDDDQFWDYFRDNLAEMNQAAKINFMNL